MSLLSLPVLVILAWWVGILIWWDRRRHVITPAHRPWTMAGFALLGLAMVVAIAGVPARPTEQAVRCVLLAEAAYGILYLRRRGLEGG